MKRIITLLFAFFPAFLAYSQTYVKDGDRCFDSYDYACAIANYDLAFKNATGKDKQIAEIKLTRARWCAEHIKTANQVFSAKNYKAAKDEYQKVLDSNPKDSYAQAQIAKCDNALNPTKLRKATAAEITDIWNNNYGVQPQRRQNLINAGIDPDDAQMRINAGEGKPQESEKQTMNLSVSKSTLYFTSFGETSEQIKVYSDASTFSVPSRIVPFWCNVKTYKDYFTVTASANPNYTSRKGWFKVIAGDKEVIIYVEQFARTSPNSQQPINPIEQTSQSKVKKCFNCPETNDIWGVTLGCIPQTIDFNSLEVIQFGLKAESLFLYGFGFNTGINLFAYSKNIFDSQIFEYGFEAYGVNIPVHLEYRLNFSKWFNIFAYGGVGFTVITKANSTNSIFPAAFEYGGGFRISHVQFNVGKSLYLGNLNNTSYFSNYIETNQKLILSVSYMF